MRPDATEDRALRALRRATTKALEAEYRRGYADGSKEAAHGELRDEYSRGYEEGVAVGAAYGASGRKLRFAEARIAELERTVQSMSAIGDALRSAYGHGWEHWLQLVVCHSDGILALANLDRERPGEIMAGLRQIGAQIAEAQKIMESFSGAACAPDPCRKTKEGA